mmetsp:Transcript_54297/g.94732  ORF Transcript_54297/g.94732 Transcript_54297/m.94732 type:complete len:197 (+) Transcript_54297:2-592(+)
MYACALSFHKKVSHVQWVPTRNPSSSASSDGEPALDSRGKPHLKAWLTLAHAHLSGRCRCINSLQGCWNGSSDPPAHASLSLQLVRCIPDLVIEVCQVVQVVIVAVLQLLFVPAQVFKVVLQGIELGSQGVVGHAHLEHHGLLLGHLCDASSGARRHGSGARFASIQRPPDLARFCFFGRSSGGSCFLILGQGSTL